MLMRCPNCNEEFEVTRDMYDGNFECSKCGIVFKIPFPVAIQVQKKDVQKPDINKVEVTDFTIGWLEMLGLCIKFIVCFTIASSLVGLIVLGVFMSCRLGGR